MEQLLIIEDDITLNQGLTKALKAEDRKLFSCANLKGARQQLALTQISLIILDINLPDGSGLDFLEEVKRQSPTLPVILLTAKDTDFDIVEGLERGADDYITKPFSLAVLRARVNTQLRKYQTAAAEQVICIDDYEFDFLHLYFSKKNEAIELSKTEQKLLYYLVQNRGTTLKRSDLIDRIWTDGAEYVDENALSVTVKRLRDKLSAQAYIKTVYGIGYVWVSSK